MTFRNTAVTAGATTLVTQLDAVIADLTNLRDMQIPALLSQTVSRVLELPCFQCLLLC